MAHQVTILRLDESIAREMREVVSSPNSAYRSIDEFVEVAIRNQLVLESDPGESAESRALRPSTQVRPVTLLSPLPEKPTFELATAVAGATALSALTNRLSPLKIAMRVVCNLTLQRGWPEVKQFQEAAARSAREVGTRLWADEERDGVRGTERRSTAFPCGDDERKALDRFIAHFTTARRKGSAPGPLEILGLVLLKDGRVQVSHDGWAFGVAPSPLLDECTGTALSEPERHLLLKQIETAPGEAAALQQLLRIIKRTAGNQQRVDELLSLAHSDWTPPLAIAHRAAIVGRTRELGLVDQEGRGVAARLQLAPAGEDWLRARATKESL